MGIVQISGCFDSTMAMEAIIANEFDGVALSGEPEPIGFAGVGNPIDWILLRYGQTVVQQESDMWEYYKSDVYGGRLLSKSLVTLEWQRV